MRALGRNATTLPGKLAFRAASGLPEFLTAGQNVTLITGTNGKTTTARMVCAIHEQAGYRVVSNVSGANLISGILTTLIEKLSLRDLQDARRRARTGQTDRQSLSPAHRQDSMLRIVLETDEGAFGRYAGRLHPTVIAVTNLFRDQLDRYGELSATRALVSKGIVGAPDAAAVLCADDSLVASMFRDGRKHLIYFGVSGEGLPTAGPQGAAVTEAGNCIFCGAPYSYRFRSYGHLGDFRCPSCGFARPAPDLECRYEHLGNNLYRMDLHYRSPEESSLPPEHLEIALPIPGEHNIYNAMTAAGVAWANHVPADAIRTGIGSSRAGFGRMEKFEVGGRDVCIVLVKNPVGLDRALSFLENASDTGGVQFLLNDNIADGTDVSWIWDVDFESRRIPPPCFVSGTRCYDMALRLKYSGIPESAIHVEPDCALGFDAALRQCPKGRCLYVFPNYTSLLTLRAYLEKKYRLRSIWA